MDIGKDGSTNCRICGVNKLKNVSILHINMDLHLFIKSWEPLNLSKSNFD